MKYSKCYLCLLFACVAVCLTGCDIFNKELTDEEKLCQNISSSIDQYQSNQINYNDFLNLIKNDYNNYCTENTSDICIFIKSMYSSNEQNLELEDCSKYNENDSVGKSMKDLCEAGNNAKKTMAEQKADVQDASVNQVKRYCEK